MSGLTWERARLGAIGLVVGMGLLVVGLLVAPAPEAVTHLERPPPPASEPAEGPDWVALDQERGMRALDAILEDRMRAEAEARGVEPVLPSREGLSDEALLVAWGDAFRAIGVELGELSTSSPAP